MRNPLPAIFAALLVACGAPPASTPTAEEPAKTTEPATELAEATAQPSAAAVASDAPKGGGLSEEKLRASAALGEPFPEIDAVTKELGPPEKSGTTPRRQWLFDKQPVGKTFGCSTIDLVRTPQGALVIDESAYTGDECKKIKRTKAQVDAAMAATEGKRFDEAAALFEKTLGKADDAGDPPFAAWRYVDDGGECKLVLLTEHLGSRASQALWGAACD